MLMQLPRLLGAYRDTRRLLHHGFTDRAALQAHQGRAWQQFERTVLSRSTHFRPWCGLPLERWPLMDKAHMMRHFDSMNTAGLRLAEVLDCAQAAERSRDFKPLLKGYGVGLSSGTSGGRGVFAVSAAERAHWAGVMLGTMLPDGLFAQERVALLLRADNPLYRSVRTPWLQFRYFDLMAPWSQHLQALDRLQPSIIVAPAQVLRALALAVRAGQLTLQPKLVISVAEVLEPQDRILLQQVFHRVAEVYQATEGFLGATCAHGTLHLNEAHLIVEPQWLDDQRFVPVITDFSRHTQPIVRYRLDDVLLARRTPCPCGSAMRAIERIEGRCDDMLQLPGLNGHPVTVFADVIARALAQALPLDADYQLEQLDARTLRLMLSPQDPQLLRRCQEHLQRLLRIQGVQVNAVTWADTRPLPPADFGRKRRRIRRLSSTAASMQEAA
ncbi:F390 synthetase-related protein [Aquabacterium sp.]|uniref:F390 synthetase-related protein n=1 Tax=Aquabacterium sp. TaxID=1872578 RepID=UPI002BBEEFC7|nr:F390 synthetase-related protein [Aquabacterium sp.]HSW05655.1 F390 synthetase-related protein [Aquabacterium sp.]